MKRRLRQAGQDGQARTGDDEGQAASGEVIGGWLWDMVSSTGIREAAVVAMGASWAPVCYASGSRQRAEQGIW
jgi:hypothetical protein